MRGLSKKILQFIKNSDDNVAVILRGVIKDIRGENKNQFFFGIRDNSIEIYCMGARVIKINFNDSGDVTNCMTNVKYIDADFVGKSKDVIIPYNQIDDCYFCDLLERVKNYTTKEKNSETIERQYQQQIMLANNDSINTEWYCLDMEYNTGEYGKLDIVTISKKENNDGKYEVIIVELKVDYDAMNGDSGIYSHFVKFDKFLKNSKDSTSFKESIVNILFNKIELGLCNEQLKNLYQKFTVDDLEEPKVVFLTYCFNNIMASNKKSFKNKVFEKDRRVKKTIKGFLTIENRSIEEFPENMYRCIFKEGDPNGPIFSDIEISEAKNIFDEEAYK